MVTIGMYLPGRQSSIAKAVQSSLINMQFWPCNKIFCSFYCFQTEIVSL